MTANDTGPTEGNVWIVSRLPQTTQAQAEDFEQRALYAPMHWDHFWMRQETSSAWRCVFELDESLYECDGHMVECWLAQSPEVDEVSLVRPGDNSLRQ